MTTSMYRYDPKALAASHQALKNDGQDYIHAEIIKNSVQGARSVNSNKKQLVVAATQLTGANLPDSSVLGFCQRAEEAIAMAVEQQGANVVLLPELWSGPYFCQSQEAVLLQTLADPAVLLDNNHNNDNDNDNNNDKDARDSQHVLLQRMQRLARHYKVVLPVSIYEQCHNVLYNSVVMIDADGTNLGTYRKTHIPDGPGYQEKFYFTPGDTAVGMAAGVFDSRVLGIRMGVAICWDQWFPETARCLALQGCEVLLYPTAIGSEPQDPSLQSSEHWQRVMQGHAAANMIPVVASNRFGTEALLHSDADDADVLVEKQRIHFYGKSFITDNTGAVVAECADNTDDTPVVVVTATIDPEKNRQERVAWGLFRDRRPDLYQPILTKDGIVK